MAVRHVLRGSLHDAESRLGDHVRSPTGIEGTEDAEPLRLTPELNVLESPRSKDSNPKALRFPLEVGKRWRYGQAFEESNRLYSRGGPTG